MTNNYSIKYSSLYYSLPGTTKKVVRSICVLRKVTQEDFTLVPKLARNSSALL